MMGLTVLFAMFGALAGCRLVMIHSPFILVLRVVNTIPSLRCGAALLFARVPHDRRVLRHGNYEKGKGNG